MPDPDVTALEGNRDRLSTEAGEASTALQAREQHSFDERDRMLAPLEDKTSGAIDELGGMKPPKSVDLPEPPKGPLVDAQDFQKFGMALIGMALIGGVASRGNWLGVSATLNGALKGYLEGNQERADREYKQYQTDFASAKAKEDQIQKEFRDVLDNKRLTINDMLTQTRIIAAKYDRQDMRFAAEQKRIDELHKQADAKDQAIAQLTRDYDKMDSQVDIAKLRMKTMSGQGEPLTDAGQKWFDAAVNVNGDKQIMQDVVGRFSGPQTRAMINHFAAIGVNPGDPIAARSAATAWQQTLSQAEKRTAGVERLTGSIKKLEARITELVKSVGGSGMMSMNEIFNSVKNQFGDAKLAELKTLMGAVGRQYIEAVTMPGSNAQLHASAQDWADGLFTPAINNQNWRGVMNAMNTEIKATTDALHDTSGGLHDKLRTGGNGTVVDLDTYLKGAVH